MSKALKKGEQTEEILRNYFLKAGYYVSRGVPYKYDGFDITDIDLWLYGRTSSVSREIAIVDIKRKRTPQAIERVFWVKGLQIAIGASRAIVATTDKRDAVKEFGRENGITILDGHFIQRIATANSALTSRISEEEFNEIIQSNALNKLDGDWKGRLFEAKSCLAKGLDFDSCNVWLNHGKYFAEQIITKPPHKELCLRVLYLLCSYIAISIDYMLRELSFLDEQKRKESIENGFRYGNRGAKGTNEIVEASIALIQQFADDGGSVASQVRNNLNKELEKLQADILSEYFSKPDVGKSLFSVAREFEELSMAREFTSHSNGSIEARSFVGCLLDYWAVDRVFFTEKK